MDRMGITEKQVKRTDGKLCLPVPLWGKWMTMEDGRVRKKKKGQMEGI